jgi:predicted nucleic-acid-binding protein
MKFLDTNVFLRYLLGDDKKQSLAAKRFFSRLEKGKEEIKTTVLVIAEIVYFLEKNAFPRQKIAKVMLHMISSPFIFLEGKEYLAAVFKLYSEKHIDFVDAYHAVYCQMNKMKNIISFDRDFDKVNFLQRKTP